VENPSYAKIYVKTQVSNCIMYFFDLETTICTSESYNWSSSCLVQSGRTELRLCHLDDDLLWDHEAGIKHVKFTFWGWQVPSGSPPYEGTVNVISAMDNPKYLPRNQVPKYEDITE
jgi:hypothetical protein